LAAERSFAFPLPLGLHARPASRIRDLAAGFRSAVSWENARTGAMADAKSVLSLLATDTQANDSCLLRARGPDEDEAVSTLARFIGTDLPLLESQAGAPLPSAGQSAAEAPRVLDLERLLYLPGTPAGAGIARGPAAIHDPALAPEAAETASNRPAAEEAAAYRAAADSLEKDLLGLAEAAANGTERAVLASHLSMLRDPAFSARVHEEIERSGLSAATAVARASRFFTDVLRASRSVYLRERMADIRDISHRLIARLGGAPAPGRSILLAEPSILVAGDLAPSEFLALDASRLLGLVLENTGPTSHTLILARARGIPAVTAISGVRDSLQPGEEIIVDGGRGLVVPSPSPAAVRYFERDRSALFEKSARNRAAARLPGRTADGRPVEVAANIGHPEEIGPAWANGAEGIGLFRTELLLLDRPAAPGEEEQYELYARLAREAQGRPVIIRTFDIGGDKPIPYLPMPFETNPFLGQRGVRIWDRFAELFRDQLRAVLRAAAAGPLKVMFPMVSTVDEVIALRERLAAIRLELERGGIRHRGDIEAGMMVEVPAAALLVDRFSQHVDFFSVGSNDLLQYSLAADRGNPAVRALSQPLHPAFLRLLRSAVDAAHERGRWIGLCGELAASAAALPLLVGLGFDELSMSAGSIPETKARLRGLDSAACRKLLEEALEKSRASEVEGLIDGFAAGAGPVDMIVPGLVRLAADCRSRAEVLQELAIMMESAGRTHDRAELERALWRREDTFSTGIGHGVAIPHCQTDAVRGISVGVLRPAVPIEWSSADGEPVDTAVMLVLPAKSPSSDHLKLLARLSRRLVHDEFRGSLRAAADAAAVVAVLEPVLSGS
jgi:phosphoenolpyruvate-protein phosphotransferase